MYVVVKQKNTPLTSFNKINFKKVYFEQNYFELSYHLSIFYYYI